MGGRKKFTPVGEGGSGRWPLPPKKLRICRLNVENISFNCTMISVIGIIWNFFAYGCNFFGW